jgi:acyl carrier protein
MTDHKVENIDSEDAGDLLVKIEKSFDIKFGDTELMHIKTLGELCDHVINKIQLDNSDDCTTQQAFYKLRDAITTLFCVDNKAITTEVPLDNFLPRQKRKEQIKDLENYLNVHLNILRPPHWVTNTLLILLLVSIVGLFFKWEYGLLGLGISFSGLWFSNKIGNELDVQTVGQLAEKMTRENYVKSRRNPKTVNKNEIEKLLTEWFIDDLGLDKSKLTREAKFV